MSTTWNEQTYYEILEVSTAASQKDIFEAFKKAKSTYAQDNPALYNVFTREEATELMRLIEDAYTVLSNPVSRADYDKRVKDKKNGVPESAVPLAPIREPSVRVNLQEASPGKTSFTNYEVDDEFEREIQRQAVFDGSFLKKIRTYKKVTLEQISEFSRIKRSHLTAIENNDFNALPAPVFVRGFLVQYSRLLGLDEKHVVHSFMKIYKDSIGK